MEMLMEFPNGESPNLFVEVFNYTLHRCAAPLDGEDRRTHGAATVSELTSCETVMESLLIR